MRNSIRHTLLVIVLLFIFAGSLGVAQAIVRHNNGAAATRSPTLVWHLEYPGNFRPLDLSHVLLPIKPSDAMVEELPDHSRRYLYIFRALASESLTDSSNELFEQFNHTVPTGRKEAMMAGQNAAELSSLTRDGFVVQRAVQIGDSLFAVTLVGDSAPTAQDIATFNQICNSVSVRREKAK